MTDSFRFLGLDSFYFTIALILLVKSLMILVSRCKVLIANLSSLVIFNLGGLTFSSVCLTIHLSSSVWALGIFKVTFSTGAIISKYETRLMVLVKLKPLLCTDSSVVSKYRSLILTTVHTEAWRVLLLLLFHLCSFPYLENLDPKMF